MLHMLYPNLHNVKWRRKRVMRKFLESIYRKIYSSAKHCLVIPYNKKMRQVPFS